MKARQLIISSPHGPETLSLLCGAFDSAWDEIASEFGKDPGSIETARLELASIVLNVASEGGRDPELIKATALKLFAVDRDAAKAT